MSNNRTLASRLKNRIEVWENKEVDSDIGNQLEGVLVKRVWASIVPLYGYKSKGEADTEGNVVQFRIIIRKTDIRSDQWIEYNGLRYDISHIMPNYTSNKYLDIQAQLRGE